MPTSGLDLIEKWISRNRDLGYSDEDLHGTSFVYGDSIYSLRKNSQGSLDIEGHQGKVVIFRDIKDMSDEYICRICGSEYNNKLETIRCCMNEE